MCGGIRNFYTDDTDAERLTLQRHNMTDILQAHQNNTSSDSFATVVEVLKKDSFMSGTLPEITKFFQFLLTTQCDHMHCREILLQPS